jgi:putative lipoic acid-binding regulatory protein
MKRAGISMVKVFSATKAKDRDELGDRVTAWLRAHPEVLVERAVVRLSSDAEFHCLSIVVFASDAGPT